MELMRGRTLLLLGPDRFFIGSAMHIPGQSRSPSLSSWIDIKVTA